MGKNIQVTKRPDSNWQAKGEGNSRASYVTKTQEHARQKARDLAVKNRSEVLIRGVDGNLRIRGLRLDASPGFIVLPPPV